MDHRRYLDTQGYRFLYVSSIEPLRDRHGQLLEFMPQARYKNMRRLGLNRYGAGPFCKFRLPARINTGGIYLICVDSEIQYVGQCENLSERFGGRNYGNISPKNCYTGGQSTNCKINHFVLCAAQKAQQISVWFHETPNLGTVARRAREKTLIVALKPPWNALAD